MDEERRRQRQIRQLIETDRLLGVESVPVDRTRTVEVQVHAGAQRSAAPAPPPTHAAPRTPQAGAQRSAAPDSPAPKAAPSGDDLNTLREELTAWVQNNWPQDGWQNVVFGEGDPNAALMFIGEGPGADEDAQGRPFVGRAGQLLDKQITAMKLKREQVYIANIAKTRPPGNRVPTPDEAEQWLPWLERQIQIIQPKVIVTLGATSAKYLLGNAKFAITRERGKWREYLGIALMPTFHPAYVLRRYTPEVRRQVWNDLQKVMEKLAE